MGQLQTSANASVFPRDAMPAEIISFPVIDAGYEVRIYDRTTISRPTEQAALDNVMREQQLKTWRSEWIPHIEGLQLTGGDVLPTDDRTPDQLIFDYLDETGAAVGMIDGETVYTDEVFAIVMHIHTVQMFPFAVSFEMVAKAQKARLKQLRGKHA